MALAMAVGYTFLALVFVSFGSTGAKDIPGTRGELVKDENGEPSWCSTLDEIDCELDEDAREIYCIKHCKEVLIPIQKSYMIKFNKSYEDEAEAEKRLAIFIENVRKINEHNKLYEAGKSKFWKGINEFTDLTYEEFLERYTGLDTSMIEEKLRDISDFYTPTDIGEEPDFLDYRDMGALTPIRNQKGCGSCWAFTAVAPIESAYFLKTGGLIEISEQDLLDCCDSCHSGCEIGGHYIAAYEYIIKRGVTLRSLYDYNAEAGTCKRAPMLFPVIEGVKVIRGYNESLLKNALVHMGPIAVQLEATKDFEEYRGGIHRDESCDTRPNHGVVIVGYGTENGTDYWIIRNSWGDHYWGEKGYMRMDRNVGTGCGLTLANIPIIAA